MKSRPILFSAPMVRALLDGSKTQTRRIAPIRNLNIRRHPGDMVTWSVSFLKAIKGVLSSHSGAKVSELQARRIIASQFNPYGQPGDQLWVRENGWERPLRTPNMMRRGADTWKPYYFDADGLTEQDSADFKAWGFKRRPSIHMPRWASRITLEITGVRVERLQDITEVDAEAEGLAAITKDGKTIKYGIPDRDGLPGNDDEGWAWTKWSTDPRKAYRTLWESINGPKSWDANPWVWVVEFKRIAQVSA